MGRFEANLWRGQMQHAAATEQRSALTHSLNELAHQVTAQVQGVESRLAELTARAGGRDDGAIP